MSTDKNAALALAHSSAGLVLRLRSVADDECQEDQWLANLLKQAAADIECLRDALKSAREELIRQRAVWTTTKNDAWAVLCIDTELARIDKALFSPNSSHEPRGN